MSLTAPPSEVAIIGGGLAGLTLALALHDLNIPATVYEAQSEDFDQGGGLMLSPNALRVLDSVGVYERVRDSSLQFDVLTFKDSQGETTNEYSLGSQKLYGYPAIRIMRKGLLDEMKAMLKERHIPIHYNARLDKITSHGPEKVEFVLANGQVVSAPLVVGADGIHSTVRSTFLLNAKAVYTRFIEIHSVVPRSKLRIPGEYNLPATVTTEHGPFQLVPHKPDSSELFIGSWREFPEQDADGWESLKKDKQKLYDMLQENKTDWPDVVQSAIEAAPVEQMSFWAFYGVLPLPSWLSGSKNIILVGDAAHFINPTAGQGVGQAFEDVRALATVLSKLSPDVPLDKAAVQWQAHRMARVKEVRNLTQQLIVKRMPESERALFFPGVIWSDPSLTRGDGGELRWLYDLDLVQEAEKWVEELKQAAQS